MKRITILGATGSIGQSTLDLIARAPDRFEVVALTGGRNVAALASAARQTGAAFAAIADPDALPALRDALSGTPTRVGAGQSAIIEAAQMPSDWCMSAIVGAAGLVPGIAALSEGTALALANKESLVAAGPVVLAAAEASGARILPVDSEHSAIFQALRGEDPATVERVIITASGGAFRDRPADELAHVTPEEAATHPNWDMGQRITIDSASLFNKALEVIEAHEFFGLAPSAIEVLIHPESLVHALVGFNDGGLMAHVGPPDMRHAIGYALNWPERRDVPVDRLDLAAVGQLNFRAPDPRRWPALGLAYQVMEAGGHSGAIFNAAKEIALDAFIARQIGFLDMGPVVEATLDRLSAESGLESAAMTLDTVLNVDQLARVRAGEVVAGYLR